MNTKNPIDTQFKMSLQCYQCDSASDGAECSNNGTGPLVGCPVDANKGCFISQGKGGLSF